MSLGRSARESSHAGMDGHSLSLAAPLKKARPSHAAIEKERRDRLNGLIEDLRELVPPTGSLPGVDVVDKRPKSHVLKDTIDLLRRITPRLAELEAAEARASASPRTHSRGANAPAGNRAGADGLPSWAARGGAGAARDGGGANGGEGGLGARDWVPPDSSAQPSNQIDAFAASAAAHLARSGPQHAGAASGGQPATSAAVAAWARAGQAGVDWDALRASGLLDQHAPFGATSPGSQGQPGPPALHPNAVSLMLSHGMQSVDASRGLALPMMYGTDAAKPSPGGGDAQNAIAAAIAAAAAGHFPQQQSVGQGTASMAGQAQIDQAMHLLHHLQQQQQQHGAGQRGNAGPSLEELETAELLQSGQLGNGAGSTK
ncbi:unnamed protein product [Pedinophyceae sp. YPF-701]|nr:unnamed protein product [Pedinophyceae sp. YPF-701]